MDVLTFKQNLDEALLVYIEEKKKLYRSIATNDTVDYIFNHIQKIALGGGKRLRPYLVYMSSQYGDKPVAFADIQNTLLGIELFHIFCLIHDDIMDKSDTRHGVTTTHTTLSTYLKEVGALGDIEHIATSQTILAGDLVFAWAQELLYTEKTKQVVGLLIEEVCIGQMLDVDIPTKQSVDTNMIERKNDLKTARYSFVRPLQIGVTIAEREDLYDFCKDFGSHIGQAFQIQDDLLDIIGDPAVTKKAIFTDIAGRQHTYLTQYIMEHGTVEQKSTLVSLLGTTISAEQYDSTRQLFTDSGAIEYGQKLFAHYCQKAEQYIETSNLRPEEKENLLRLTQYITKRNN